MKKKKQVVRRGAVCSVCGGDVRMLCKNCLAKITVSLRRPYLWKRLVS